MSDMRYIKVRFPVFLSLIISCTAFASAQNPHYFRFPPGAGHSEFIGLSAAELPNAYDSVYLFVDNHSQPQYYYQRILTPVCEDTLCKLVKLTYKWDLLGNYLYYYMEDGDTLTKLDHKPFSIEDYNKLHSILSDNKSVLGTYTKEYISGLLKDNSDQGGNPKVDVVSGATPEQLRTEIIEGALYSCHTLWHLCRGKLRDQILAHTGEHLFNEDFIGQLIRSGNIDYIKFAFANLKGVDATMYHNDIIQVIKANDNMTASQVILYIPEQMVTNEVFSRQLWDLFDEMQYLSQRQILKKLALYNQLPNSILVELIIHSENAIESQFVQILTILFKQMEIGTNQEQQIKQITTIRKEQMSKASLQLISSLPYHSNMSALRNNILQILN